MSLSRRRPITPCAFDLRAAFWSTVLLHRFHFASHRAMCSRAFDRRPHRFVRSFPSGQHTFIAHRRALPLPDQSVSDSSRDGQPQHSDNRQSSPRLRKVPIDESTGRCAHPLWFNQRSLGFGAWIFPNSVKPFFKKKMSAPVLSCPFLSPPVTFKTTSPLTC